MNPSPFERTTFWTVVVGYTVQVLSLAINQPSVQRYISLPTLGKARLSIYLFMSGMILLISLATYAGLLLYAEYYDCDPLKSKKITKPDQMMTYYIMKVSTRTPGLPGLFVAGVLSASLSTFSSQLNSIGVTMFEDFVSPWFKNGVSQTLTSRIMKVTVIIFGVLCIAMVFVIEHLGEITQVATSFVGVTGGTTLGLFSLGMVYPRANYKGALSGGILSLAITMWLALGAQSAIASGSIKMHSLPTTASGCGYNDTVPHNSTSIVTEDDTFILYKISFSYFSVLGFLIVFIIGIPVSLLTELPNNEQLKPEFFTPLVRKYVINKRRTYNICDIKEVEMKMLSGKTIA